MKVRRCSLPKASVFNSGVAIDYVDCYQLTVLDVNNIITPYFLGKSFFTSAPKWVQNLFEFREKFARFIGLKTADEKEDRLKVLDNFNCEVGQQLGLFKVFEKTEHEVILGQDDKHLDFRISIFVEELNDQQKTITLSTTVKFNNVFGKLYFFPVKPFHKLIVPSMMKGMVKNHIP
jgi:hypothetical protein